MKKEMKFNLSFIFGIIILLISIYMYIKNNTQWHYPAVVGIWLFFDFLAFKVNKNSSLNLIFSHKIKKFFLWFSILFGLGFFIEVIGRIFLNLWYYTNFLDTTLIGYLFYPFILMSFKETYCFLKKFSRNKFILTFFSMVIGIIIWEIPNLFSKDWIYTIPYINFNLLGINIIVILGWIFLIIPPVYIYNKFIEKIK